MRSWTHILSRNLQAGDEDSEDDVEEPNLTLEDEDDGVEEDITFIEEGCSTHCRTTLGSTLTPTPLTVLATACAVKPTNGIS